MLKKELYDSLLALSTQKRCTFFVLLLACFNLLLHIYGRQDDIIVGTPVSGRSRAELEKLIGCFADFIAIRTTIKSSTGFPGLLNQVKKECMEAFEHQNLPFQKLLEELELPGTPGRPPVFRVILNMLNYEDMQPDFPGAAVSRIEVDKQRVDVDLKVLLMKKTDGLSIILYYNTDLFTSTAMAGFLANFHHLLESIAANPEQKLSTIKSLIEVK
jgi:non-ribosomal peptide synthetase component F